MFQFNPLMLLKKPFDCSTFVNLGIIEYYDEQCLGEPLVELVEEGQERLGRPPLGPFPIAALGPEMQGPEQRGALALGRGGDFGLGAFAKPSTLDVGFIGKV